MSDLFCFSEALVEIEDEEGEDYDPVEIAEGHIALDGCK